MTDLTQTAIWQDLVQHQQDIAELSVMDCFNETSDRFKQFSLAAAGLFLDYSKQRIAPQTMVLLLELAEQRQLPAAIAALLAGEPVNTTEQRPAWHTALREPDPMPEVQAVLDQMAALSTAVRSGALRGYDDQPITDIVHLGIGGSDLGPAMVYQALQATQDYHLQCHYLSCPDEQLVMDCLHSLNPATTLLIVVSKSFTTQETLFNANLAKAWLTAAAGHWAAASGQVFAVTAAPQQAMSWGVSRSQILPLWDWVGGRFSLCSAASLSLVMALGMDVFTELLAGAHALDVHFATAPLAENMPVILALLSIWYVNFFAVEHQAIVPYSAYLSLFPDYCQQLHMESLGKQVRADGEPVTLSTGPVIWGGVGTDSQHSFHQLFMQGTGLYPVDFILPLNEPVMTAHCVAQSQALLQGQQSRDPHQIVPGNQPSSTLCFAEITPKTLGALVALYEHKVYVQGVIWGINPFDQWGVELGKQITMQVLTDLQARTVSAKQAPATHALLEKIIEMTS